MRPRSACASIESQPCEPSNSEVPVKTLGSSVGCVRMQPKAQWPSLIGSARKAKASEAGTSTRAETQCDRLEEDITCGFLAIDFLEQVFHRVDIENLLHFQRAIVDSPNQCRARH